MQTIVQFYKQNANFLNKNEYIRIMFWKSTLSWVKSQNSWLQNSSTIGYNKWLKLTIYCLTWKWIMFNDRMFRVLLLVMHMIPFAWLTCCRHCHLINLYIPIFRVTGRCSRNQYHRFFISSALYLKILLLKTCR